MKRAALSLVLLAIVLAGAAACCAPTRRETRAAVAANRGAEAAAPMAVQDPASAPSRKHGGAISVPVERQNGVSWVAGSPVSAEDLRPLIADNVGWIAQNPFGWQETFDSPRIVTVSAGHALWGEQDIGLETTARLARSLGIKTLLRPHIWLTENRDGKWLGAIEMKSDEDWGKWFADYRAFILHYAALAEHTGMEALSIGAELHTAAVTRENDWRRLIAEVRGVYHGKLTYAANWYREFEEIRFWDALDFIGIQAYFPVSEGESPSVESVKERWGTHLAAIEKVQRKYHKPVVFTEIGYKSTPDAAVRPWEWPARGVRAEASEAGLETQRACYEAFFETFWDKDWFAGAYFWKWYPSTRVTLGRMGQDFTPQHKPAEAVLAKWYARKAALTRNRLR